MPLPLCDHCLRNPVSSRGSRSCRACQQAGYHREAAQDALSARNYETWRLVRAGVLPDRTHGGEAAERRGLSISVSNIRQPRRKKREE